MTADAPDLTAATAAELADLLRVTPRRVRQLAEEGRLRRRGRGAFDVAHAIHGRLGAALLGQDAARGIDADTLAAIGWLGSFTGKLAAPVTPDDLAAWREGCARWGLGEAEATGLLVAAAAIMGPRAPSFRAAA